MCVLGVVLLGPNDDKEKLVDSEDGVEPSEGEGASDCSSETGTELGFMQAGSTVPALNHQSLG